MKTAHAESKTPPVEHLAKATAEAAVATAPDVDTKILHAALSRVARLLGYQDEHSPEHSSDLDTTGLSPKYAGIVQWAKGAKLP